jgi:hypothetical protein
MWSVSDDSDCRLCNPQVETSFHDFNLFSRNLICIQHYNDNIQRTTLPLLLLLRPVTFPGPFFLRVVPYSADVFQAAFKIFRL